MSEPIYSVTTERVYARLPEIYRTLDIQNNWQFKKYISSIADQLNDVDVLSARLDYIAPELRKEWYASGNNENTYVRPAGIENPAIGFAPIYETSDLLDARTADVDWLPYLCQLVGIDLNIFPTVDERRDAVINSFTGYRAGSREALEASVVSLLTGTKYSRVYPQYKSTGGSSFEQGTQWDVLIITRPEESPASSVIIDKIIREGAKPAGVVIYHLAYALVWSVIESTFSTWTQIEAFESWSDLESRGAESLPV